MKVHAGRQYVYDPVLLDRFDGRTNLHKGDVVKVVNLPGCPRANTMGHCHVQYLNGTFAGLVCCNSLHELKSDRAAQILLELQQEASKS